jgi:hypothetical protein
VDMERDADVSELQVVSIFNVRVVYPEVEYA